MYISNISYWELSDQNYYHHQDTWTWYQSLWYKVSYLVQIIDETCYKSSVTEIQACYSWFWLEKYDNIHYKIMNVWREIEKSFNNKNDQTNS